MAESRLRRLRRSWSRRRLRRGGSRAAVSLSLALMLAGCSLIDEIFPSREDPPLPGERIAVMVNERDLEPDTRIAGLDVVLPRPYVNADWPKPGGSPSHAMYHLGLSEAPQRAWSVSIGGGSSSSRKLLATPVVSNGRVFAMDIDFRVSALDAASGQRIWRFAPEIPRADRDAFGGGLAVMDGRVYVTTGLGTVFALDAADGKEIWKQSLSGPVRAGPTVAGGRVFVVTIDNQLWALEVATGRREWSHTAISEAAGLLGGSSPAVDGSTVIVPYSSGELFAIRAETGRVAWSDSLTAVRRIDALATLSHIRGHPVIDRGLVFAVSHSGRMAAIDQRSGARIWERSIGGVDTPWVAGDFLYVLSNENEVFCLTRDGGRIRWMHQLANFERPDRKRNPIHWSGPVLAGDRLIVVGSHGEAITLSPYTGGALGRIRLPDRIFLPPVVADGTIYFLTENGQLTAYR